MELLQIEIIRPPSNIIHISPKTEKTVDDSTYESVSELTGVAIPTYFELQIKGTMNIHKTLLEGDFHFESKGLE